MLLLFCILTAVPAILMLHALKPELVLPALSVLLFAEALIAAIVARLIDAPGSMADVDLWDFAGAFALIGCAAAVFGEPDHAALFLEAEQRGPASRPR
jgi:hypothetical protein